VTGPLASRRQAVSAAAAAALGLALARPARAAAPGDVEQLERLLALERRLEATYETALARDAIEPGLGETLLAHEREHARGVGEAIRARGGGAPRATAPPPRLGAALARRAEFARYAARLEAETVAVYQAVLATLRDERLLQPLGSIMAAGAQHGVALREVAGDDLLALA
jgi:Ferritin-like domain